jgi:NADPH:quinone reductase-like Zn-dependent oxidoreductase
MEEIYYTGPPFALQSFLDNGHTSTQSASAEMDQQAGVPEIKVIVIDDYGGVEQLHLRELPDPRPHADEVLVRVRAAGVNPVDWKVRQGQPRFILRPNFPFVPGGDIAGEVVAAGADAAPFKAGDLVVGFFGFEATGRLCRVGGRKENCRCGEVAII